MPYLKQNSAIFVALLFYLVFVVCPLTQNCFPFEVLVTRKVTVTFFTSPQKQIKFLQFKSQKNKLFLIYSGVFKLTSL